MRLLVVGSLLSAITCVVVLAYGASLCGESHARVPVATPGPVLGTQPESATDPRGEAAVEPDRAEKAPAVVAPDSANGAS